MLIRFSAPSCTYLKRKSTLKLSLHSIPVSSAYREDTIYMYIALYYQIHEEHVLDYILLQVAHKKLKEYKLLLATQQLNVYRHSLITSYVGQHTYHITLKEIEVTHNEILTFGLQG